MSSITATKLYVRVAVLRRRVLLRQLIRRTIAGALGVAALVVNTGLATYALFLAIKSPIGELGAVLSIAALYLAMALSLLLYTLHEPASSELDALEEMEAAALESAAADTQGIVRAFSAAGHRIEDFGNTVSLSIGILSTLRRLLITPKRTSD